MKTENTYGGVGNLCGIQGHIDSSLILWYTNNATLNDLTFNKRIAIVVRFNICLCFLVVAETGNTINSSG